MLMPKVLRQNQEPERYISIPATTTQVKKVMMKSAIKTDKPNNTETLDSTVDNIKAHGQKRAET